MADASKLIDQYVGKHTDWRGDVMAKLRAIIKKADPRLQEEWKWDTPVFTCNGNVCAIGVFKESVKLNFFKGASLPDPHHLFNSGLDAKASRSIDFGKGDPINREALQKLIGAAAAKNAGKR